MDTIELINWYYRKSKITLDLGLSNEFLFRMIPNNVKRRYGFPTSRWPGRCKRLRKQAMESYLQHLLEERIFNLLYPAFDEFIGRMIQRSIDNLVDYRDIDLGDSAIFTVDSNE